MRDWAQDALLDGEEIDKERGVISKKNVEEECSSVYRINTFRCCSMDPFTPNVCLSELNRF
jgi:hypothetical protein